jgi:hypothetical protein
MGDRVPDRDVRGLCGLGGSAAHASAMTDFARVLVWIALAVWLAVFVAMLRRGVELVRGERT